MNKILLVGLAGCLLSVTQAHAQTSEQTIVQGKKVDCTVIRPWTSTPSSGSYPVIFWANGWGSQNVDVTAGYKPGLIEWAESGPYVVVAANSRSPRESDVQGCVNWMVSQANNPASEYHGLVDLSRVGMAGHSQGGGVVIIADGARTALNYVSVLAMTPYASNWRGANNQSGPALIIAGSADDVAPADTYATPAWQEIQSSGEGGAYATLLGGDHNTDAWGPAGQDPNQFNFGRYQYVSELWWQYTLKQDSSVGATLKTLLDNTPWQTVYEVTPSFNLQ